MKSVNRAPAELEPKENVFLGILGALLFSLAGAVVYFFLNRVGYIASISATIGAFCACFGYALFSHKKDSKTGRIVAAVVTVLVMLFAVVFCLAFDLYEYIQNIYGDVKLTTVLGETVRSLFSGGDSIEYGYYVFSFEKATFVRNLIGTLVFTGFGITSFISAQRNKRKAASQTAQTVPDQAITPPTVPENDAADAPNTVE